MERKRQKLVGRDKGSLTEQQTEGTATTTIQKRGTHRTNRTTPQRRSPTQDRLRTLPSCEWVPTTLPLPPTGTQHDGTWYGIPGSVWPGWGWVSPLSCVPSWILVKINPVLAKPRTERHTFLQNLSLRSYERGMEMKWWLSRLPCMLIKSKSCTTHHLFSLLYVNIENA